MNKNIIVYKVRLPWKIGVIFVDKDEKLISRIQSKMKIKLKWIFRHKRNNDVFLYMAVINKKDLELYRKLLDKYFVDILLTESFDNQIAIEESYDSVINLFTNTKEKVKGFDIIVQ